MTAQSTVAESKPADVPYVDALAHALVDSALPGEIEDFTGAEKMEAARFIAACAERRPPGIALVRLESMGGSVGQRRMRIGIVNDDMPFLVDSVAGRERVGDRVDQERHVVIDDADPHPPMSDGAAH